VQAVLRQAEPRDLLRVCHAQARPPEKSHRAAAAATEAMAVLSIY
jgi:hypothetical protein